MPGTLHRELDPLGRTSKIRGSAPGGRTASICPVPRRQRSSHRWPVHVWPRACWPPQAGDRALCARQGPAGEGGFGARSHRASSRGPGDELRAARQQVLQQAVPTGPQQRAAEAGPATDPHTDAAGAVDMLPGPALEVRPAELPADLAAFTGSHSELAASHALLPVNGQQPMALVPPRCWRLHAKRRRHRVTQRRVGVRLSLLPALPPRVPGAATPWLFGGWSHS